MILCCNLLRSTESVFVWLIGFLRETRQKNRKLDRKIATDWFSLQMCYNNQGSLQLGTRNTACIPTAVAGIPALTHQHCLPGNALAGSWNQEPELGVVPWHGSMGSSGLNPQVKCSFLLRRSNYSKTLFFKQPSLMNSEINSCVTGTVCAKSVEVKERSVTSLTSPLCLYFPRMKLKLCLRKELLLKHSWIHLTAPSPFYKTRKKDQNWKLLTPEKSKMISQCCWLIKIRKYYH